MQNFPLDNKRIIYLVIGILTMIIGFFIMTLDKSEFGFGFLGITLGPILVLIGVILPIFSLFNVLKNGK
ncbi:DUF3098 domain-containing protein [Aquirufa sp. ROCK2-A2]